MRISMVDDSKRDDAGLRDMTPRTCKAARILIAMDQIDLAERAGVGVQTIRNFENEVSTPSYKTWQAIKRALEQAGIQFIDENGGGPGVRLRKPVAK